MDERYKAAVADLFPFDDGEDFDGWFKRLRRQPIGVRALAAAAIETVVGQIKGERVARKRLWIAAARLAFDPGERRPCFVCGRYASVTEAHHVIPLGQQFDRGFVTADQEHEWLCPTHHTIIHVWLEKMLPNQRSWDVHKELEEAEGLVVAALLERSNRRP